MRVIIIQKILSTMRKAITDYNMIENGDKIAVGVSGGKDSIVLLMALNQLRRFLPQKFDIMAIVISLGFETFDPSPLVSLFNELDIDFHIEDTFISRVVFDERKEKSPCSLCSNMKRGALHSAAKALGCNKLALGHHMDDVIETFFLSLLYEGRINSFSPVTYLDRRDITVIRPMIYTEEKLIKSFVKKKQITPVPSGCKVDGITKREDMKKLIHSLSIDNKYLKSNLFGAIKKSEIKGWRI